MNDPGVNRVSGTAAAESGDRPAAGRVLVRARRLAKSFPDAAGKWQRVAAMVRLLAGRPPAGGLDILCDIDFTVRAGESFGILGVNGAGKSTLLKIVAGVMPPSAGSIEVSGRTAALLELSAGFQADLTGLDNIRMKAALLGITPRRLKRKLDEIIAFADLGEAIHRPVKHYSSGMVVRLGFAVLAASDPDLLITDEVLAVGDESFQHKCIHWLDRYLAVGGTLLLVSHSIYQVKRLCRQALWLHGGRVRMQGDVHAVSQAYLAWHETKERTTDLAQRRIDPLRYQVLAARILNGRGESIETLPIGGTLVVEADLSSPDGAMPIAGIGITRSDGVPVYGVAADHDKAHGVRVGDIWRYRLVYPSCSLLPGQYRIQVHAFDPPGIRLMDSVEYPLAVSGQARELGVVRLAHRWEVPDESPGA